MVKRGPMFKKIQKRFRSKRFAEVEQIIRTVLKFKSEVTILDAGGRGVYWQMLASDLRDRVRITAINFEDQLSNFDSFEDSVSVENVVGDACDMPQFDQCSFDIVHSNSVIEHLGSYRNMVRFAKEASRIGNAYYVQTPYFWFPIEPHYAVPFVHWLPDPLRLSLLTSLPLGLSKKLSYLDALSEVDHTRIVDRRLMRNLFPQSRIVNERFFLLTKSVAAIRDFDQKRCLEPR